MEKILKFTDKIRRLKDEELKEKDIYKWKIEEYQEELKKICVETHKKRTKTNRNKCILKWSQIPSMSKSSSTSTSLNILITILNDLLYICNINIFEFIYLIFQRIFFFYSFIKTFKILTILLNLSFLVHFFSSKQKNSPYLLYYYWNFCFATNRLFYIYLFLNFLQNNVQFFWTFDFMR